MVNGHNVSKFYTNNAEFKSGSGVTVSDRGKRCGSVSMHGLYSWNCTYMTNGSKSLLVPADSIYWESLRGRPMNKKTSPIWALCLIKNTKLVGQKLSLQQLAIHPMNNPIMQSVSQLVKTLQWIIYTWWLWSFHSWYTLGLNPIVNPCSINSHWPFTKIEVSYNLHIVTGWWFQTCLFSIIYGIILPID